MSKQDASGCKAIDGSLVVAGSFGKPPYDYSVNGGVFQTNPQFGSLGAGTYSVEVKDANGCKKSIDVVIDAANSTLNATRVVVNNSQCAAPNGSITVTGTGGKPPYFYLFGIGGFTPNNVLSNIKEGTYNVVVKDSEDCLKSFGVVVGRENMGIKYSTQIKPIFDLSCNVPNCHGAGTGPRDWTVFANVSSQKDRIKLRTGNRTMPIIGNGISALTQTQIDLIACWVDDGALNN
ncbi:MAG: SprB repeat-containing protein [Bacteroidetes bacterium]|nr:SprB repeat-containing protein [Bacteroidota bacterium]